MNIQGVLVCYPKGDIAKNIILLQVTSDAKATLCMCSSMEFSPAGILASNVLYTTKSVPNYNHSTTTLHFLNTSNASHKSIHVTFCFTTPIPLNNFHMMF